ncbi:MAG TPA: cell envelope integrity protein TolA [Methylophilus sp.]|nr:cell envelope integrity protein TolA [Methylophilus sp.]HQQ33888.1 cell envelope integrity protein TolA [Methylophilus sp.]
MFRKHEDPDKVKAGALAVLVHLALLGGMLISFNWKSAHQILNVTEVELWDKLPAPKLTPPPPLPRPVVEEKPEPKPEPKPVVQEKPQPKVEEKADIELDKKKKELAEKQKQEEAKRQEQKKIEEKKLADLEKKKEREKLLQAMRDEDMSHEKPDNEALKKIQAEVSSESTAHENAAKASANASVIGEYTDKIKAKIRGNVNKTLCGDGNPELRFEIALLPTGELSGTPKLVKSSGSPACDEAVERAIIASEPLPVPSDASLFAQFRNTRLKFRPND